MTHRTLDPRRTCAECGKKGATKARLCLVCIMEILAFDNPKSRRGKAYLADINKRRAVRLGGGR